MVAVVALLYLHQDWWSLVLAVRACSGVQRVLRADLRLLVRPERGLEPLAQVLAALAWCQVQAVVRPVQPGRQEHPEQVCPVRPELHLGLPGSMHLGRQG